MKKIAVTVAVLALGLAACQPKAEDNAVGNEANVEDAANADVNAATNDAVDASNAADNALDAASNAIDNAGQPSRTPAMPLRTRPTTRRTKRFAVLGGRTPVRRAAPSFLGE